MFSVEFDPTIELTFRLSVPFVALTVAEPVNVSVPIASVDEPPLCMTFCAVKLPAVSVAASVLKPLFVRFPDTVKLPPPVSVTLPLDNVIWENEKLPAQRLPLREQPAIADDKAGIALPQRAGPQTRRTVRGPSVGKIALGGDAIVVGTAHVRPIGVRGGG